MPAPEIPDPRADSTSRALPSAAIVATTILLAYQGFAAFSRVLINDDYQTLYTAWLKAEGKVPGRDFFLASYYLLPDLLAFFFRLNLGTWAPLYVGRLFLVGIMAIVAILLYRITTRLFSSAAGWLAPVFALSSAAMIYRGLDLRPDLITTATWLGCFALLCSPSLSDRKATALGMLLGLSVLNRFKAAFIAPFLLIEYFARRRERSLWRAALFTALGAVMLFLAYLIWIAATEDLRTFFEINGRLLGGMGDFAALGAGSRRGTFSSSVTFDAIYWVLAGLGLIFRARRHAAYDSRQNRLCLLLVALAVSTVVFNPAYYSYNLVTLQSLLAPFAAYAVAQGIQLGIARPTVAALLAVLPALVQAPLFARSLITSNRYQKDLQAFLLFYTSPNATVFAMEGVGLYRPSIFHWRTPRILVGRYRMGEWRFADELRRNPAEVIVLSYRLPAWLVWSDRQFIANHYQALTPLILVPGFATDGGDGEYLGDLLVAGEYEAIKQGIGRCALNGEPFSSGTHWIVRAGSHRVTASGARCGLRRYYPLQARALLASADGLPYLLPPYIGPMPKDLPVWKDATSLRAKTP